MPRYGYNLDNYVKEKKIAGIPNDLTNKIFLKIIDRLKYSHRQGVVHRDLKPENILINSEKDVVISDFGIAMVKNDNSNLTVSFQGFDSGLFTAPEVRLQVKNICEKADLYSLGRILQFLVNSDLGDDYTW